MMGAPFQNAKWNKIPLTLQFPLETRTLQKPEHFGEMLELASRLGEGFSFVRVDLYDLPSGPRFGEMTFTPGGGIERFTPSSADRMFGDYWTGPLV